MTREPEHDAGEDNWVADALAQGFEDLGIDPSQLTPGQVEAVVAKINEDVLPKAVELLLGQLYARKSTMLLDWQRVREDFAASLLPYWAPAFDLLQMISVTAYESAEYFGNRQRRQGAGKQDSTFEALRRLHGRGCQIGFEIMTLLRGGYAAGAHARWRTLHEVAVVSNFIADQGDDVAERYLAHDVVESYKAAKVYQANCHMLGFEPLGNDEVESLRVMSEDACLRFGRDFGSEYGWAAAALGKSHPRFADIEADVGLGHWRPPYKLASQSIHATTMGIRFNLGHIPGEPDRILTGPTNFGLADPGHAMAVSLYQLTTALLMVQPSFDRLRVLGAMEALVKDAGEAFLKAQRQIEAEANQR